MSETSGADRATAPAPTADASAAQGTPAVEPDVEAAAAAVGRRQRRDRRVLAVGAVGVAGAVAVVGLLGGFTPRRDLRTEVAPGTVITTGPFELSFTSGTVQHKTGSEEWDVVLRGTGRTTGDTTINPGVGARDFVYVSSLFDGGTQPARLFQQVTDGDETVSANLVPGLATVPIEVDFRFTSDPGTEVLAGVFELEYTTPYILSDELSWESTRRWSSTRFTLEQLPEQKY